MSNSVRYIIRWVFGAGIIAAAIAMLAEPFFAELFRQAGLDSSKWVTPLLSLFREPLTHLIIALALGFCAGFWTAITIKIRAASAPIQTGALTRPDTRLRVRLDQNGSKHFIQDYVGNIDTWKQTVVAIQSDDPRGPNLHVDTVSLTFEQSVDYDRPVVDAKGGDLGSYNFYSLGDKGAVFQFHGPIQATLIDIWFPPVGHYDALNRLNENRFSSQGGNS